MWGGSNLEAVVEDARGIGGKNGHDRRQASQTVALKRRNMAAGKKLKQRRVRLRSVAHERIACAMRKNSTRWAGCALCSPGICAPYHHKISGEKDCFNQARQAAALTLRHHRDDWWLWEG